MELRPEDQRERDARETTLQKCLEERSQRLARMYAGALKAVRDVNNPDRFALAAHDLRELMEKFSVDIAVDMPEHRQKMGVKARELQQQWENAKNRSRCNEDNSWQGEIDTPLRKILVKIDDFFTWLNKHVPRRKEEVGKLLDKLDGAGQQLPEFLRNRNVDNWDDLKQFFINVAHHGHETNDDEFAKHRFALEDTFLNLLKPRIFADHEELDAIIMGGGKNANS